MLPLLLALFLVLFFSWFQYLYVRKPGLFYLIATTFLIGLMSASMVGLWTDVRALAGILLFSALTQALFYWLFFKRFSDDHNA